MGTFGHRDTITGTSAPTGSSDFTSDRSFTVEPQTPPRMRRPRNDNDYVDADDSYRHSKWLAFMERRLRLARDLLRTDHAILIVTIDENELFAPWHVAQAGVSRCSGPNGEHREQSEGDRPLQRVLQS